MSRAVIALPLGLALLGGAFLKDPGDAALKLTSSQKAVHASIMKYGYPSTANLRYRKGYVLSHDGKNKTAYWVAEKLNTRRLRPGNADRDNSSFQADPSIPFEHRATLADYAGSGFDRGHLAPAADFRGSQSKMDESFFLSNMSPQVGINFNRHYWKTLEGKVRGWAKNIHVNGEDKKVKSLFVFTGPLYLPGEPDGDGKRFVRYQVIGDGHVGVPTHFFKVMLAETKDNERHLLALVLPNEVILGSTKLKEFLESVDQVEEWSGLNFWSALEDTEENRMEQQVPDLVWSPR